MLTFRLSKDLGLPLGPSESFNLMGTSWYKRFQILSGVINWSTNHRAFPFTRNGRFQNTIYEGAEVETDINVLDGEICPRTSLCGHVAPTKDILVEDVSAEDIPVEDMMSTQGLYDLLYDLCPRRGRPCQGHGVPTGTSIQVWTSLPQRRRPRRGRPWQGRPWRGHHVRKGTMGTFMSISTSAP